MISRGVDENTYFSWNFISDWFASHALGAVVVYRRHVISCNLPLSLSAMIIGEAYAGYFKPRAIDHDDRSRMECFYLMGLFRWFIYHQGPCNELLASNFNVAFVVNVAPYLPAHFAAVARDGWARLINFQIINDVGGHLYFAPHF